jgi:hypothetical protein
VLARFAKYLDRTWEFQDLLVHVHDGRQKPRIPARPVWLSEFGMHAMRLGSHHALGQQLKMPARWEPWVGEIKPSIRTCERSLEVCDLQGQREMIVLVGQDSKRKKTFHRLYEDKHWVAAIDGLEPYCSFKRCCPECLTREVTVGNAKVTQYYHRYVVLQLVGVTPVLPLDIEPLLRGDTETSAGLRLLRRFTQRCPRFLDAVTMDAFYLQAPFVLEALQFGLILLVVLKQENRELYRDAEGIRKITPSHTLHAVDKVSEVWDLEGLTSWESLGLPVRVVASLEKQTRQERIAGEKKERIDERDWQWAVIAPKGAEPIPSELVIRWGHARWDEETRGFGELTRYWELDHNYHHHPQAMLANLMILFLAFFLTTVFFDRNLKAPLREDQTRLHLSQLFMDDLVLQEQTSFWAQPP